MKIKIYSPCDGELDLIEKVNDEVFKSKMLGDGFFIKPKNNEISTPLEKAKIVNIFDTQHAFIINKNNINMLVHIGINTVNLNGEPFKVQKKLNDSVELKETIVNVDFELIKEKNIDESVCVTFVNSSDFANTNTVIEKSGNVKKGDLIGYIEYDEQKNKIDILEFKNKYERLAESVYLAVGGKENFEKIWNCMTRLRFKIKQKNKVNEIAIKETKNIEGFVWMENELQIVIGPDVEKYKEALDSFILNGGGNKTKTAGNFLTKTKNGVSGVMTALIPYLISTALLQAVLTILVQTDLLPDISTSYSPIDLRFLTNYNVFAGVMYIICTTGLTFMGFAFCYSTVKYLGGNTLIGGLIGLSLIAPQLFGGLSWELFKVGQISVKVQSYSNIIIPQVLAAILYVNLDKLLKKIIPAYLDLVFRHFFAILIVLLLTFFLIGPSMALLELAFYNLLVLVDKAPFGISTAIFAALSQPFTLMGIAWPVGAPFLAMISSGTPSAMYAGLYVSHFAQIGAVMSVLFMTKNSNLKKVAITATITGFCGVTEPAIYSVNVPRFKPFVSGIIGAFIGALVAGALGAKMYAISSGGIFFFAAFISGGVMNLVYAIIGSAIALAVSFAINWFWWHEFKNEKKEFKLITKLIELELKRENKNPSDKFNGLVLKDDYIQELTEIKKLFSLKSELQVKKNNAEEKLDKIKQSLYRKAIKLKENDPKITELNNVYTSNKNLEKIKIWNEEIEKMNQQIDLLETKTQINEKKIIEEFKNAIIEIDNESYRLYLENRLFNLLNDAWIVFQIKEKKTTNKKELGINKNAKIKI